MKLLFISSLLVAATNAADVSMYIMFDDRWCMYVGVLQISCLQFQWICKFDIYSNHPSILYSLPPYSHNRQYNIG